jgi:recombinational DNA repair protein (RecF pathway)
MCPKNTEITVGIVIKTEPARDADLRTRLLCPDGIKTFTAAGVLKQNAKLTPCVQLFTIAEFTTVGGKIIGANVLHTNHEITQDIKRYYLACAICNVVSQLPHHEDHGIFELVAHAFSLLCNPCDTRKIYTEFFTALLIELGFDIDERESINTAYLHHLDIKIPDTKMYL